MLMRQTLPYTSQDVVLAIVDVSAYSIRVGPAILSRSHGTLDRRCCGWSGLLAYNPLSLIRQDHALSCANLRFGAGWRRAFHSFRSVSRMSS